MQNGALKAAVFLFVVFLNWPMLNNWVALWMGELRHTDWSKGEWGYFLFFCYAFMHFVEEGIINLLKLHTYFWEETDRFLWEIEIGIY